MSKPAAVRAVSQIDFRFGRYYRITYASGKTRIAHTVNSIPSAALRLMDSKTPFTVICDDGATEKTWKE